MFLISDFLEKKSFQLRKQSAKILEEKIKNDYEKNWEKVREQLRVFIQKKFAENTSHYIKRILEDREYSYTEYNRRFNLFNEKKIEPEERITNKILAIYCERKTIYGKGYNTYYALSERNFHFIEFGGRRISNKYFPCANCRKNGKLEYVLTIVDVEQFIDFFELTEKEIKQLPKQMINYLNQARCLYNGNSILDDLDPVSLIDNPWWVSSHSNSEPQITLSLALCKFCKKKYEK